MATTTAKTKQDVDSMDSRARLYDRLSFLYGQKGDKITREFDKARSQADRTALAKGMQRSSYNGQIQANLDKSKIDALDENESALIADYERGIGELEQREAEEARWQKQFDEGVRQFDTNLAYNKEQAELNRAFQTSEREAQQAWQAGENEKTRAYNTSEREATQIWQAGENEKTRAYNTKEREAQQAWQSAESLLQRNWQTEENRLSREQSQSQFEANMAYNRERAAVADAQWEKQYQEALREFNENMAYQKERAKVSDAQWEKTYAAARSEFEASMAENRRQFEANLASQVAAREQAQAQFDAQQALAREQMAQSQAQYEQNLAWQREQAATAQSQWQAEFDEGVRQFNLKNTPTTSTYSPAPYNPPAKDDTGTDTDKGKATDESLLGDINNPTKTPTVRNIVTSAPSLTTGVSLTGTNTYQKNEYMSKKNQTIHAIKD